MAELTNKQLRRGVHRSVLQLKAAIREFIAAHHANPKPFIWTKTADEILANIARFAQRTLDFQAAPLITRTTRSGRRFRTLVMSEDGPKQHVAVSVLEFESTQTIIGIFEWLGEDRHFATRILLPTRPDRGH